LHRAAGWLAVLALGWALGLSAARAEAGLCTCATARGTNGWCELHELGFVGGVKVTSRWLYEAADAHGHDVDTSTFICPTCQSAIATNGFCDAHRIGFVDRRAYFSRLTYELAKGRIRPAASITCPTCRKNSETFGWCAKSKVGMVGEVAIANKRDFDTAVGALKIFMIANQAAARCRYCAVAIITDTECPVCKITYKNGKALP
jgi:hypothetical protein